MSCKTTMVCSNGVKRTYLRCKGKNANGKRCSRTIKNHDLCPIHREMQWKRNEFKPRLQRSKSMSSFDDLKTMNVNISNQKLVLNITNSVVVVQNPTSKETQTKKEKNVDESFDSIHKTNHSDDPCKLTILFLYMYCMAQLMFMAYKDYCFRQEQGTLPRLEYGIQDMINQTIEMTKHFLFPEESTSLVLF